MLDIEK